MNDVLQGICADKRGHVAARRRAQPLSGLMRRARSAGRPRGFAAALRRRARAEGIALICEIKKASPSQGLIRPDFDPARLARAYRDGGAACLSVLTDAPYFQGEDRHLQRARRAVELPVLRKDFMLEPYQIVESRALGADCVLLILAALDDGQAAELAATAREWGMDILAEVHDAAEMERALALDADMIGINNRDLKTLRVDLATTRRLAARVPPERLLVCESGLHTRADLLAMRGYGARAFLIGEALMRQGDVAAATAALLGSAPAPGDAAASTSGAPP